MEDGRRAMLASRAATVPAVVDEFSDRFRHTRVRRVLLAAGAAIFVAWWAWPVLTDRDDLVLAAGDPVLAASERAIATHVRDRGQRFLAAPSTVVSCDHAAVRAEVDRLDARRVVLAATVDGCDLSPLVAELRRAHRTVVVLVAPGLGEDAAPPGARLVDAGSIVGAEPIRTERPCEWWDEEFARPCGDDGVAVLRDDLGEITPRGIDRIGRAIAARLG